MLGGPLGGERWEVGARGGIPPCFGHRLTVSSLGLSFCVRSGNSWL